MSLELFERFLRTSQFANDEGAARAPDLITRYEPDAAVAAKRCVERVEWITAPVDACHANRILYVNACVLVYSAHFASFSFF